MARLRELEAEALRLKDRDLSALSIGKQKIYEDRLNRLDKSHSRSWFGDHSSTYYADFQPPPGGRSFDVEWGFIPGFHGSNNPGWRIFSRDEIRAFVFEDIGEDIFQATHKLADEVAEQFSNVRDQALDAMDALSGEVASKAILRYNVVIESQTKPYTVVDYINACAKSTPTMTRDLEEVAKGKNVPAHVQYIGPLRVFGSEPEATP